MIQKKDSVFIAKLSAEACQSFAKFENSEAVVKVNCLDNLPVSYYFPNFLKKLIGFNLHYPKLLIADKLTLSKGPDAGATIECHRDRKINESK